MTISCSKTTTLAVATANAAKPVTTLSTAAQKSALCLYLIDSAIEPVDTFLDIDYVRYADFICEAEELSREARLALAITLLSEILLSVQAQQQTAQALATAHFKQPSQALKLEVK